jgi:hypothetical protein
MIFSRADPTSGFQIKVYDKDHGSQALHWLQQANRLHQERPQEGQRIAAIAGHEWQHWLIGAFKMFVHPGRAAGAGSATATERNKAGPGEARRSRR